MTDSALKKKIPCLSLVGAMFSLSRVQDKKKENGIKNKCSQTQLFSIDWLTVCPDTQQRLKSKLLVEMLKKGTLRRHRDQRGGSLLLSFTRGPQKPWFKGPIPSFFPPPTSPTDTHQHRNPRPTSTYWLVVAYFVINFFVRVLIFNVAAFFFKQFKKVLSHMLGLDL